MMAFRTRGPVTSPGAAFRASATGAISANREGGRVAPRHKHVILSPLDGGWSDTRTTVPAIWTLIHADGSNSSERTAMGGEGACRLDMNAEDFVTR